MPTRPRPKVLSWGSDVDDRTLDEAARAASLACVPGHVALMPDAHAGYGPPIGTVIPTEGAIIPYAIGVDIGCGMIATETDLVAGDLPDSLRRLMPLVEQRIPAGMGKRFTSGASATARSALAALGRPATQLDAKQEETAAAQFGTLGSGNHFVEVCLDEHDHVWLVLHSGSRGIGNQLAQRAVTEAKGLMRKWFVELPDPNLAYLVQGTPEFTQYVADMQWAQRYAFGSRQAMMTAAETSLFEVVGRGSVTRTINCFAGETKVLTRTGTRPIAELAGAHHELLTAGGEWVKAPVNAFGRQLVSEIVLSRSGVEKTIRATAEHRWLLRSRGGAVREVTTDELQPGDRLQHVFPSRPAGRSVDPEGAARGLVYGDGSVTSAHRSCADSCGNKDQALSSLFVGLGRPPRQYGSLVRINGLPRAWKSERPDLDADPSELYGWLAGYFAADGDVDRTGRPTLASASRDDLEHVRLACQAVGVGTFGIRPRRRLGFGSEVGDLHLVGLMRADLDPEFFLIPQHRERFEAGRQAAERRGWNVVSVRPTGERVEVFCAVVDGTHSFALEDNILTRNCHHNFARMEHHHGRDVWITRKGAIKAGVGDLGVIPGSMGTRSYIVEGLGNPASYDSCSHGAGRRMSRKRARQELTVESFREAMGDREWLSGQAEALLDEHPSSYKDIDQVMADQVDLVRPLHTLRQVFNYKGL